MARAGGVRLCNHNCIGDANLLDREVTCFGTTFEVPVTAGCIGVISQSGTFARNGMISVATIEEMVECAMLAGRLPTACKPGRA